MTDKVEPVAGTPAFWWVKPGWPSACLAPFSALYGWISGRRMRGPAGFRAPVPVLCIGNFTLGGAGKTPTAIALARAAKDAGIRIGFLSRGYGGTQPGPVVVEAGKHSAKEVGDEPLLLAREALTVISRTRVEGARLLAEKGVDLIIMDDGFQSARVHADFALVVVDARRGIGNGRVFPAGPLRAPLETQMNAVSALLLVGEGQAGEAFAKNVSRPVHRARLVPVPNPTVEGQSVLAFAGIADPAKFHRTLAEMGAQIALARNFADHAQLSDAEIEALLADADQAGLKLATTAKDAARLMGRQGVASRLLDRVTVIEVEMAFADVSVPAALLKSALAAGKRRLSA